MSGAQILLSTRCWPTLALCVINADFLMATGEIIYVSTLLTWLGPLKLYSTGKGLVGLALNCQRVLFLERWFARYFADAEQRDDRGRHFQIQEQLLEYLDGRRRVFDVPLDLRGTPFQMDVWDRISAIPYGVVATYGVIAHLIGDPKASRAVGNANGSNPLPIFVPCHRVIGSNGSLAGYSGGLPIKRRLLTHEGVFPSDSIQLSLFSNVDKSALRPAYSVIRRAANTCRGVV